MENKNNMNIVLASVICLVVIGVLVFISIRNKTNMATENNNTNPVVNNENNKSNKNKVVSLHLNFQRC